MREIVPTPTIVLRFRDLVTEPGGTIDSHRALIRSFGETWWGWMKRTDEIANRKFFAKIVNDIKRNNTGVAFLFDTDSRKFYRATLTEIAVAPDKMRIGSPEPEKTPEYYNHGRYPAWFQFIGIQQCKFPRRVHFAAFPSALNEHSLAHHKTGELRSAEDLKNVDHLTLWVIQSRLIVGKHRSS
jgi:hypothetical protein